MKIPFRKDLPVVEFTPTGEFDLEAWRARHARTGDLERIRHAFDERLMAHLATRLEDQESGLREAIELVTRETDRLSTCLYAIYVAQNLDLASIEEQTAACLIFGQDFRGLALVLAREAREVGQGWHDDLEDPQVFEVEASFALRIACDPRSPYSYLRYPLRDGCWGIVPLPDYFAQIYRGL
jgi:hypothetical protein